MDALKTVRVDAAAGWWIVNAASGLVIESVEFALRDDDLPPVVRFDMNEWREWCADAGLESDGDVYWLALGFWLECGKYEHAEGDFRADIIVNYAES